MTDFVKIAIQTALTVAVIEVVTMDGVAVEVVLAEVAAATVMTATLAASPSIHYLILLTRIVCTNISL